MSTALDGAISFAFIPITHVCLLGCALLIALVPAAVARAKKKPVPATQRVGPGWLCCQGRRRKSEIELTTHGGVVSRVAHDPYFIADVPRSSALPILCYAGSSHFIFPVFAALLSAAGVLLIVLVVILRESWRPATSSPSPAISPNLASAAEAVGAIAGIALVFMGTVSFRTFPLAHNLAALVHITLSALAQALIAAATAQLRSSVSSFPSGVDHLGRGYGELTRLLRWRVASVVISVSCLALIGPCYAVERARAAETRRRRAAARAAAKESSRQRGISASLGPLPRVSVSLQALQASTGGGSRGALLSASHTPAQGLSPAVGPTVSSATAHCADTPILYGHDVLQAPGHDLGQGQGQGQGQNQGRQLLLHTSLTGHRLGVGGLAPLGEQHEHEYGADNEPGNGYGHEAARNLDMATGVPGTAEEHREEEKQSTEIAILPSSTAVSADGVGSEALPPPECEKSRIVTPSCVTLTRNAAAAPAASVAPATGTSGIAGTASAAKAAHAPAADIVTGKEATASLAEVSFTESYRFEDSTTSLHSPTEPAGNCSSTVFLGGGGSSSSALVSSSATASPFPTPSCPIGPITLTDSTASNNATTNGTSTGNSGFFLSSHPLSQHASSGGAGRSRLRWAGPSSSSGNGGLRGRLSRPSSASHSLAPTAPFTPSRSAAAGLASGGGMDAIAVERGSFVVPCALPFPPNSGSAHSLGSHGHGPDGSGSAASSATSSVAGSARGSLSSPCPLPAPRRLTACQRLLCVRLTVERGWRLHLSLWALSQYVALVGAAVYYGSFIGEFSHIRIAI